LKPRVYDAGDWQIPRIYPVLKDPALEAKEIDPRINSYLHQDFAVFDSLIHYATAGSVAPRFRFLHFFAAHSPWTVDRSCDYASGDSGRAMAIGSAQCALSRVYAYLQRLDEIGVYDRSLIFIVGDHGSRRYIPIEPSLADPPLPAVAEPPPNDTYDGPKQSYRGVPLFLVKPIGERGPLRLSDVPVSLCDVPRSIFDALDMEGDFGCESIFSREIAHRTWRMHYRRKGPREKGRSFGFEKFAVVGHSWLRESWRSVADESDSVVRSSTEPPP
jgi:hypothetical protein